MKTLKWLVLSVVAVGALPLQAQDIYKLEMFSSTDLNGTARFVGMGGSMSSLGAEISTIATNPAGIGMFRRSDVSLSGSVTAQPDARSFYDVSKARASFDQLGFVYAMRLSEDDGLKFVNFGFNYQKRRNFKNYIGVDNMLTGGLSQSWQMMDLSYLNNGWLDLRNDNDREMTTPLALLGFDTQMLEMITDENDKVKEYVPVDADSYSYKRVQWGGIQQYDFNLSMNWNNQVYAGITVGAYNVNYHSYTDYSEMIVNPADNTLHEYYTTNEESLTGTGFDVKLGAILRPIEDSPFRLGFSFHTPTFYDLKSSQYLYMNSPFSHIDKAGNEIPFTDKELDTGVNEYRIRTPWRFNISVGTTIGNYLALNAEYEYNDYSTAQVRYGSYDTYWDDWNKAQKDRALCDESKRFMKGVSTLRLGAELRVADGAYVRAGYNYVSSPFKKNAYLNLFTSSPSYYYSANTDYVNLGEINRATLGFGLRKKHWYADLAYQYQAQSGDLYAFHLPEDGSELNRLSAKKVQLDRHNFMLTLGYKF